MLPSLSIDRRTLPLGVESTVRVLLELIAPPAPTRPGPPLDVVVVLDPTLTGECDPVLAAAEVTADLLRVARPDDRIGVVAVDRDAMLVLPLGHHDPEFAIRAIRTWQTATPASAETGRSIAAELLTTAVRDDAEQRIVVLTDGGPAAKLAQLFGAGLAARGVVVTVSWSPAVAQLEVLDEPAPRPPATGDDHLRPRDPDDGLIIELGDTYGGEVRRVALALVLHPPPTEGPLDLAQVRVRWIEPGVDGAAHTLVLPLTTHVHVLGYMNP